MEELEKKNLVIENMKQENERVLMEKNGDINRLETGKIFNVHVYFYFH